MNKSNVSPQDAAHAEGMANRRECLLFFTKWPQPGQVKTRLAQDIGAEHGIQLYTRFVEDLALQLQEMKVQTICCFHPPEQKRAFQSWLGPGFAYLAQEGPTLGERLEQAFIHAYSLDFDRVVVIGSDSPDLPRAFLVQAIESLQSHGAVIGPSEDGGYYLIGFHVDAFCPSVFSDIAWSTERVLDQTLGALQRRDTNTHLLPTWHDVDTGKDLDRLLTRHRDGSSAISKTLDYCRAQGWDRAPR